MSEEHERESSEAKAQLREEVTSKVEAALSEVEAIREQRVELEQRLHQVNTYVLNPWHFLLGFGPFFEGGIGLALLHESLYLQPGILNVKPQTLNLETPTRSRSS